MHYEIFVLAILLIYLTHRLENAMSANSDKLDAALARLTASVAAEMRQLADAITAGDTPLSTAADKLNALADTLDSDDAPVTPPAPAP